MSNNLIIGCSHVEGFELEQELGYDVQMLPISSQEEVYSYRKANRFATKLFNRLNLPHEALFKTGCDNSWIVYNLVDRVTKSKHKYDNIIVCWTGITRQQRYFKGNEFFFNPLYPGHIQNLINFKNRKESDDILKWEEVEHEHFLDFEFYNRQTHHFMNYVKLFLEQRNINFFYLNSIQNDLDLTNYTYNSLEISFKEFCLKGNFKQAKYGHYLSDAHQAWADYIYTKLKNNFTR